MLRKKISLRKKGADSGGGGEETVREKKEESAPERIIILKAPILRWTKEGGVKKKNLPREESETFQKLTQNYVGRRSQTIRGETREEGRGEKREHQLFTRKKNNKRRARPPSGKREEGSRRKGQ